MVDEHTFEPNEDFEAAQVSQREASCCASARVLVAVWFSPFSLPL